MNLHVPQTAEARIEALELLSVVRNLNTPRNGEPLIACTQDFITALHLLTGKDVFYGRAAAMQCVAWATDACSSADCGGETWTVRRLPEPAILAPVPLWTGKQLFTVVVRADGRVPPDSWRAVCCDGAEKAYSGHEGPFCPHDGYVQVRGGELLAGQVGKRTLGVNSHCSLLYVLSRTVSAEAAALCMGRLARFAARWAPAPARVPPGGRAPRRLPRRPHPPAARLHDGGDARVAHQPDAERSARADGHAVPASPTARQRTHDHGHVRRQGQHHQHLADGGVRRAADGGRHPRASGFLSAHAAAFRPRRPDPGGGRLCGQLVSLRHERHRVFLPLHGGARGSRGHGGEDRRDRLSAAAADEGAGGSARRVRWHGAHQRRRGGAVCERWGWAGCGGDGGRRWRGGRLDALAAHRAMDASSGAGAGGDGCRAATAAADGMEAAAVAAVDADAAVGTPDRRTGIGRGIAAVDRFAMARADGHGPSTDAAGVSATGHGGGRAGRPVRGRALHSDDPQDVPFRRRGQYEHHSGRAAHQGTDECRAGHCHPTGDRQRVGHVGVGIDDDRRHGGAARVGARATGVGAAGTRHPRSVAVATAGDMGGARRVDAFGVARRPGRRTPTTPSLPRHRLASGWQRRGSGRDGADVGGPPHRPPPPPHRLEWSSRCRRGCRAGAPETTAAAGGAARRARRQAGGGERGAAGDGAVVDIARRPLPPPGRDRRPALPDELGGRRRAVRHLQPRVGGRARAGHRGRSRHHHPRDAGDDGLARHHRGRATRPAAGGCDDLSRAGAGRDALRYRAYALQHADAGQFREHRRPPVRGGGARTLRSGGRGERVRHHGQAGATRHGHVSGGMGGGGGGGGAGGGGQGGEGDEATR
eukprot:ctg_2189.g346